MNNKTKLWAAFIVAGVILWAGCAAPTASVNQFDLRGLSTQKLDVGLLLDMKNPNEFSVPLDGIDWGLSLFDTSVADGHARPETEIPAKGSTQVDVPISLRLSELSDTASRLVRSSEIPWDIGGTCHFNVPTGSVAVNFNRSGRWDNPLR